jgi:hypothetical protein
MVRLTSPAGRREFGVAVAGVLAVLLQPVPLTAQGFCFHPRPIARCSWFSVTEAGVALSVPSDEDPNLTFQAGALANVGSRSAIGGVLVGAVFQNDVRLGVRARYRHWLTDRLSLDIAPGVLLYNGAFMADSPGFTGELALGYADWIALTAQLDVVPFEFSTETRGFFGVKIGSYPGAAAAGVAVIWAGVAAAIFSGIDKQ